MATHIRLRNSHAKNTLRTSCDYHFLWKESAKEERMSERSVATSLWRRYKRGLPSSQQLLRWKLPG